MSIGLATTTRNNRGQAVIEDIDSGADPSYMKFYTAPRPVTGGVVTDLIGANELYDPSGSMSNGVLTFNLISDELSVKKTGDIAWARITDGDGVFVMDMDCGLSGSGAEIIFDNLSAQLGGTIKILSGSITEGNL